MQGTPGAADRERPICQVCEVQGASIRYVGVNLCTGCYVAEFGAVARREQ